MKRSIGLLVLFLLPMVLLGQTPRSATGGQATLWGGGELSIYNPDWGCASDIPFDCSTLLIGPTAYFDFNWNKKLSAEGDAQWLIWHGPGSEKESSYLIGPRYQVFDRNRYSFYGRFGIGGDWVTTSNYPQAGSLKGSFFAIAPGADLDYRLSDRMTVRADYEYEFLPSFSGGAGHNHGLSPNGFSFGVAWRLLGQ